MKKKLTLLSLLLLTSCSRLLPLGHDRFCFKDAFLEQLIAEIPGVLKNQDPNTGRFGKGIWIAEEQNVIFPMAAAWATKSPKNPYCHDSNLLEAIMKAGDALIDAQDDSGQWEFNTKAGENWGKTYMPWTYGAWIRAYDLIRNDMPPDCRERWQKALKLGFSGISKTQLTVMQNIPAYHATSLYVAGIALHRPDWCAQARKFLHKVVEAQDRGGYWSEHSGPVVIYNTVYVNTLGTYYGYSHDPEILPALRRAAVFHSNFTYPDGRAVETIDERSLYNENLRFGNIGFVFTPEGRGYLAQQLRLLGKNKMTVDLDNLAAFILYGTEGPLIPTSAEESDRRFFLQDKALIQRKAPWFICMSAFTAPVSQNRWIQDRQNFVSIYHDRCGLILGGGNTKLQPLWSNFSVGDTALLFHKAGDTNPDFAVREGLVHIPSSANLMDAASPGLDLEYGQERCEIAVDIISSNTLRIRLSASTKSRMPVEAHLTLYPNLKMPFQTERTPPCDLDTANFDMTRDAAGGWIRHNGWELTLPEGARIRWPVLPHYPYSQDGSAGRFFGRIVVSLPFSQEKQEYSLMLKVE